MGLRLNDLFKQIAYITRIAKALSLHLNFAAENGLQAMMCRAAQLVRVLAAKVQKDFQQLSWRVVWKMDVAVKARGQSRVGVDEMVHLFGVARHNHHQVISMVFHQFEQRFNGLMTEVLAAFTG